MQFKIKVLLVLITIFLVALGAFLYMSLQSRSNISVESLSFEVNVEGWRISRVIKAKITNTGSENVTITGVEVNGKSVNRWTSGSRVLTPKESTFIYIYYPWKSSTQYSVKISTSGGEGILEAKSPQFSKILLKLTNVGGDVWEGVFSFETYFSDGECKPKGIKVFNEYGEEVASQMWGIVTYESGYVKTAIISFHVSIPPGGEKTFAITLGVEPKAYESNPNILVEESDEYIRVINGRIIVGFNNSDRYHGSIDYFGDVEGSYNFAEIFKPPEATLSELYFFHGFLDSVLDSSGKMFAIIMKTEISIESKGPLLVVVKRSWKLRDLGTAYDFYAIPQNSTSIYYRFVIDAVKNIGLGALAGEGEYTIYNPAGMGSFAIGHLAVKGADFFLTAEGDIYSPLYPGMDVSAEKPIASCVDHETGVGVQLISNDEVNPIGYWHISKQKFPWHIWGGDKPSPSTSEIGGYKYAKDLSFIAGVHKYLLCYSGEQSDPWRGNGISIEPGTYSWVMEVKAVIKKSISTELQEMFERKATLLVEASFKD
ncbi:MAG: hypothetical protein J7L38_00910 [Thermoproteales archaeon]|nr:hypothetical protein [Thermoproteales archaeon]